MSWRTLFLPTSRLMLGWDRPGARTMSRCEYSLLRMEGLACASVTCRCAMDGGYTFVPSEAFQRAVGSARPCSLMVGMTVRVRMASTTEQGRRGRGMLKTMSSPLPATDGDTAPSPPRTKGDAAPRKLPELEALLARARELIHLGNERVAAARGSKGARSAGADAYSAAISCLTLTRVLCEYLNPFQDALGWPERFRRLAMICDFFLLRGTAKVATGRATEAVEDWERAIRIVRDTLTVLPATARFGTERLPASLGDLCRTLVDHHRKTGHEASACAMEERHKMLLARVLSAQGVTPGTDAVTTLTPINTSAPHSAGS